MSSVSSTRFLVFLFLAFFSFAHGSTVTAQRQLDLSVHLSPQLRYVTSQDNDRLRAPGATTGNSGLAVGYSFGAAVEYPLFGEVYLRAGVDYAHKRHHYTVNRLGNDIRPAGSGENSVTYRALEVPVQLLYRFGFRNKRNNLLVGAGIVAAKFVGDPRVSSSFSDKDLTGFESLATEGTNWSVFAGYEHLLGRNLVLSFEPYLAFSPDRLYLETNSYAKVAAEGGIRLRMTLDN